VVVSVGVGIFGFWSTKTTYIDSEFGIGVVVGQCCAGCAGILRMNDGAEKEEDSGEPTLG
jgi:hypothetical protein